MPLKLRRLVEPRRGPVLFGVLVAAATASGLTDYVSLPAALAVALVLAVGAMTLREWVFIERGRESSGREIGELQRLLIGLERATACSHAEYEESIIRSGTSSRMEAIGARLPTKRESSIRTAWRGGGSSSSLPPTWPRRPWEAWTSLPWRRWLAKPKRFGSWKEADWRTTSSSSDHQSLRRQPGSGRFTTTGQGCGSHFVS
jgi:hypothetical protein